jgi:hypothetical protein
MNRKITVHLIYNIFKYITLKLITKKRIVTYILYEIIMYVRRLYSGRENTLLVSLRAS